MNLELFIIGTFMLIGMDIPRDYQDHGDLFQDYIATNHERSYITVLEGFGNMNPLYFEAGISPYYMIRLKEQHRWAIELNPAMRIRMQREASFPIRTPSYMPGITYYHNLKPQVSGNKKVVPFLSLVHHSNGQNGDFYNENGSINTEGGNFSTNYLELGAFMTHLAPHNPGQRKFYKSYLEYHFASDPHLKGKYGFFRANFEFQMIHQLSAYRDKNGKERERSRKHRIRQSIHASWIFGEMGAANALNAKERLTFEYTFSYHPKIAEDMSVFVQYYYGQDYYNIYFNRNISVLRFGLMTDQLKFW